MLTKKYYILFLISIAVSVFKAQIPTATILTPTTTLCSDKAFTFLTNTTNTPTAYSWSVSPANSVGIFPNLNGQAIVLTFSNSGIFVVSLNVANASGSTTTSQTLTINKSAKALFNASLNNVGFPNQLNLTNYSSNALSYNWLFSDDATIYSTTNILKSYITSGSYSVTLISFGIVGCNDTSGYAFRISDSSSFYLPNIFSPNNDNVNDIFKPVAQGIKELHVWIYNRYGVIIYDWDKPKGFWDGYTTSGLPCDAGIYFCVAEALGFDNKSYKLKGNVTLVK